MADKIIKDKEQTIKRILDAVGEIFRTEGQQGLKIARIAAKAGVDRALIYRYFKNDIKNLIEAYVIDRDYWMKFAVKINSDIAKKSHNSSKDLVIDILQNHWRYFSTDKHMQDLILWELSGESELMKSIHNTREMNAQPVIDVLEEQFKGSNVNIKAVTVLLLGGIYYANMHTRYNGSIMCGMDINGEQSEKEILKTIAQIVEWAYRDLK